MASYDNEANLVDDEYDDLDDFIVESDDGDDVGEEEEEEEDLPEAEEEEEEVKQEEEEEPPIGVQEILSIREQLKAKYRKQHQSNGAGAGTTSSSPSVQEPARSRFGTFFGPSTPALAPRLIEAGSSSIMKETQYVPSRRDAAPSASNTEPNNASAHEQKPKIVPQAKRKVDTLRENRDYSNLFSDDANAADPAKETPENKPVVSPKPDVEIRGKPMQPAGKNKVHTGQPARAPKDHGSAQGRVQSKPGSVVKKPLPLPNGRKTNPSLGNGSRPSNGDNKALGPQPSSNGQNLQRSMQSKRPQPSPAVQKQQQPSQTQRPPQVQRQQNHAQQSWEVRKVNSSVQSQQQPAPKGSALSQDRRKLLGQKQLAPSSKPKASPTSAVYSDRPKKTVGVKRKLSEAERVRQMVRDVFNYNPDKYAGRDEDDRNMEAGYASIQMEERRSAKLARKEDDEQLQMIQEEERRERANKKKKQRAQS